MANKNTQFRGPRRRVEKIRNVLYHQSTNAITTKALHTVEDSKTLVRMRGRMVLQHDDLSDESFHATIAISPANQAIGSLAPSIAEDLDQDCPTQFLLEVTEQASIVAGSAGRVATWEFDSKAMRKLKAGDVIHWKDIAGGADSWFVFGEIEMWFKE